MTFGVAEPATMAAATAPIVIVIARSRPRAGKPAFLVSRAVITSVVIIVIARPRATSIVVAIATAGGAFALLPAATSSLRVPGAIPKPATMVAAAAPVVIVIARSRPRAGKPAFLVARAVITSVVIIVIARPRRAPIVIVARG